MNTEFMEALSDLEHDKGIKKDVLLEAIETALISAYKRHFGTDQNARVEIDGDTGEIKVFAIKNVVDEVEDEDTEISVEDAHAIHEKYEAGDVLETEVTPRDFGRIAAQTAKQVVVQRIREAERGIIYDQYSEKENEVLTAIVHRIERGNVYVELGRAEGIIPVSETVYSEQYNINDRLKVYVLEVKKTNKGPQIIVSRTHPALIKRLFEIEVPEIRQNVVQIKSIAREAGGRTKIAVWSDEKDVDPVGACVGHKGTRIEKVVEELGGEKIDVVPWSSDPIEFIANALRPAKVVMVQINEDEKAAKVIVPDYQLSLAIGKEGQNARLAAKLTGWKIDIKSQSQTEQEVFGEAFANADTSFDSLADTFGVVDRLNEESAVEEAEEELILDELAKNEGEEDEGVSDQEETK
ncbi:transcription termination factor NusA [Christensenella tenuis]|uniref:Transcription termination/antitermination protein NusA n=1 Tax=Christensenella tenuis TaxID=2763033 RepID=A0ABR7ED29_9FIRM|nr:transcription termination factor NusA [Christensenella tenuis]MBC5647226.1 transcription termination/antitermination protein NusA [Christensenella tenuis]